MLGRAGSASSGLGNLGTAGTLVEPVSKFPVSSHPGNLCCLGAWAACHRKSGSFKCQMLFPRRAGWWCGCHRNLQRGKRGACTSNVRGGVPVLCVRLHSYLVPAAGLQRVCLVRPFWQQKETGRLVRVPLFPVRARGKDVNAENVPVSHCSILKPCLGCQVCGDPAGLCSSSHHTG